MKETRKQKIARQQDRAAGRAADRAFDPIRAALDRDELAIGPSDHELGCLGAVPTVHCVCDRADLQTQAEALYEEIGGDLCLCQRADVPHWCEGCQRRIGLIADAFRRVIAG